MTFFSSLGKTIVVIVLVIALGVGAWFTYWAVALRSANNRYDVNTHSQQYQSGVVDLLRDKVAGYDLATDPAQKANFAQTICARYTELTNPPEDLIEAHARICN